MLSALVLGKMIFHWVSYVNVWCDKILFHPFPILVYLQNLTGVTYIFYLLCCYFPFLHRLLLRAYPQSKFSCVPALPTATRLNVCVLTGAVLMQKVLKIFLNSLEERSACVLSAAVRISIPVVSARSCFNHEF